VFIGPNTIGVARCNGNASAIASKIVTLAEQHAPKSIWIPRPVVGVTGGQSRLAFLSALPIAVLGGSIGLSIILIISAVGIFQHSKVK
jgi:hypothetical protein